jgi:cell division protein FtsB
MKPPASAHSGAETGQSRLPPRHVQSPWVRRGLVFLICALAVNALVGERGLLETFRIRRQLRQASAEVAALRRENARLLEYALQLRTDARAIEDLARAELGLIRKGEVLVVVKDVPAR